MQTKKWEIKVAILWLCLSVGSACLGKVIYVDANAPGAGNGTSWADAYNYLQDALTDANSDPNVNQIWVAEGVYIPGICFADPDEDGDNTATFQLLSGVTLKGGYAGFGEPDPNSRDTEAHETFLSGDLNGNDIEVTDPCDLLLEPTRYDNIRHILTANGTDSSAVLDGFTIIGGQGDDYYGNGGGMYSYDGSPTLIDCTFEGNCAGNEGGGIYCLFGSPILTDCTFTGNSAGDGGGIFNWEASILTRCTFNANSAERYGGGMLNMGGPVLIDCRFSRNTAGRMGGAIGSFDTFGNATIVGCEFEKNWAADGGAIGAEQSGSELTNCIFIENSAYYGGGLSNSASGASLVGSTFVGNSASESGGAVSNDSSTLILTNCSLSGNSAGNYGGGVFHHVYDWGALSVKHCSFAGNTAEKGTALACDRTPSWYLRGDIQVMNCILWDGGSEIWNYEFPNMTVGYSDIQGGLASVYDPCEGIIWDEGNIDVDPCFADPGYWDANGTLEDANDDFWADGDYHLKSQGGRYDPNEGRWTTDGVTSPCIDAGDPMSPIGLESFPNGGIINMGAYGGTTEASKSYFGGPPCETIIAGDINGDCEVNFEDFRLMALHWLEEH